MKAALAAFVAIVILWIVDAYSNGGRYAAATLRLARPVLSQIGIQI